MKFIQHILLSLLMCMQASCTLSYGQYPYMYNTYPFIQYEQNHLISPNNNHRFLPFFKKLDQLIFSGKGNIHILHIGGSHVQADIFSGRIRERFSTFFPGNKGSRGLVFPYRIANTNNPYNYVAGYTGKWESCKNTQHGTFCELGITGISSTTKDTTASISLSLKTDYYQSYDFNRIRVFHKNDSNQFSIYPVDVDTNFYRIVNNMPNGYTDILFTGYYHSITLGFKQTDSLQWGFTLYGLQLENNDPGITYHAAGVNGAGTYSFIRCVLLTSQLRILKPDLVIFGLGINDAASKDFDGSVFERNYRKLIDSVLIANPDAAIILITNNDSFRKYKKKYYVNKNGESVQRIMLQIAKEKNISVWDFFSIMGGLGSMETWMNNGLGKKDRVHFSTPGYKLMGDLLFEAILKEYEIYLMHTYNKQK